MEHHSNLAVSGDPAAVEAFRQDRSRRYRHKIRTLAYVSLESANGGILRDLSEGGMAVQALAPLRENQAVKVRIDLPAPRLHLEADARVAWSDALGQAGLEFVELPERARLALKDWLFTQLLMGAHRTAGDEAAQLLFSSGSRPAIRLEPTRLPSSTPRLVSSKPSPRVRFLWFSASASQFALLVDALALLCAVLLFHVMALSLTDTLPSWPIATALFLGFSAAIAGLYWLLFSVLIGVTPGNRLAELAVHGDSGRGGTRDERARFR